MPLRPCSGPLAAVLTNNLGAGGRPRLWAADLFTITLQTGTVYRFTSWPVVLFVGATPFAPSKPWLSRGRGNVANTMEVATLEVFIDADNSSFSSGPSLKQQLHNGLFDGASVLLQCAYMTTPGDTSALGTIDIFSGDSGPVQIGPVRSTLKVRSKNSRLAANAPRNVYQPGCLHTFCDAGCTLSAGSFTISATVGSGFTPTRSVLPWVKLTGAALFKGGTVTMTSGAANGQVRSIIDSQSTQITLAYPLSVAPASGDTFSAFQGCGKTMAACTTYGNFVNFRGFPYIPPPASSAVGQ